MNTEGQRAFVVDFKGAGDIPDGIVPEVWSSAGEVFAPRGQVVAQSGVYRVAFELDPEPRGHRRDARGAVLGRQALGRNLAVPVDSMTTRHSGSVPPFAELDMPEQNLRRYVRERRLARTSFKTLLARLVTFGGALALTVYATLEMIAVVSVGIVSVLQWAMVALFAITFGWIALTAAAAVSGVLFGGVRRRAKREMRVEQRTALVMPVYNENPAGTFSALFAMADALLEEDATGFEIFVLSDTTRAELYIKETAAYHALREKLGDRHARLVPAPLRQRRPQSRQSAGLRDALGRPLRLHDRARRGQHSRSRQLS